MKFNTIQIGKENHIASIALNRPDVHNAFNEEMMEELRQAFVFFDQDNTVRVLVLKGHGPSFCAGADLSYMKSASQKTHEQNVEESLKMATLFQIIQSLSKPVVALLQGAVFGGGIGLASACDIVLADENTRFAFSEVKLGLAPSVISPFVIRKIGIAQANRFFLTGEVFKADVAKQIGLVHDIYTAETADKLLAYICENLLKNSPQSMAEIKDLIQMNTELSGEKLSHYTANHIASLRTSEEGQEGLTAFFEKRKPKYSL